VKVKLDGQISGRGQKHEKVLPKYVLLKKNDFDVTLFQIIYTPSNISLCKIWRLWQAKNHSA